MIPRRYPQYLVGALPPFIRRTLRKLASTSKRSIMHRNNMTGTNPEHVVHILHIGKTGGTAIRYAFEHGIENSSSTKGPDLVRFRSADYLVSVYDHSVTLLDIPPGEKVIFFLRDPVNRFVSGFNSRKRHGRPRYNIPWTRKEAAVFTRFETSTALGEALSSSNSRDRHAATRAMRDLQHSKLSYSFWLISKAYLMSRLADVFFIGFQERFDADFELLKAKLLLPTSVQLPKGDVESHRAPDALDVSLSKLATANLRNWHSADYEIFALCQEKADQLNRASVTLAESVSPVNCDITRR